MAAQPISRQLLAVGYVDSPKVEEPKAMEIGTTKQSVRVAKGVSLASQLGVWANSPSNRKKHFDEFVVAKMPLIATMYSHHF